MREPVRGVCELLGLDPLYVANEGKLLAIVARDGRRSGAGRDAPASRGREARIVGEVVGRSAHDWSC